MITVVEHEMAGKWHVISKFDTTFLSPLKNGWLFCWALGEGGVGGRFHQKATTANAAPTAAGIVYTQICTEKHIEYHIKLKTRKVL